MLNLNMLQLTALVKYVINVVQLEMLYAYTNSGTIGMRLCSFFILKKYFLNP